MASREETGDVTVAVVDVDTDWEVVQFENNDGAAMGIEVGDVAVVERETMEKTPVEVETSEDYLFLMITQAKSTLELDQVVDEFGIWKGLRNKNGDSVLHVAAREGNIEAILYFLLRMEKEEIERKNGNGRSPFHEAVCSGNRIFLEVAEAFEFHGANISAVVHDKGASESILHVAVKAANVDALTYFISKGADVNSKDNLGNTPLHILQHVSEGYQEMLKILVAAGANINAQNGTGSTPFHYAAANRNDTDLKEMLDNGAALDEPNNLGFTPAHAAVSQGNYNGLKFLIDEGANMQACSQDHRTPLHEVAFSNAEVFSQILDLFSSGGVDFNEVDINGFSPLTYCVLRGRTVEEVKRLISHGADWRLKNKKGDGVVHLAANVGELELIKFFVDDVEIGESEERADVNTTNDLGGTPLHSVASVFLNFREIVDYLYRKGADINKKDQFGETLLMLATRNGNPKGNLEHVVKMGADWKVTNNEGQSILHYAAQNKLVCKRRQTDPRISDEAMQQAKEVIAYFVSLGADVSARSAIGRTPLHHLMFTEDCFIVQAMDSFVKECDQNEELQKLLNAVDDKGANVIFVATSLGKGPNLLKELVRRGANWKVTNGDQFSILHVAVEAGNLQAAKYFIEMGADVNAKGKDDETPLFRLRFARKNLLAILKLLMENGAGINATDSWGNNLFLRSVSKGASTKRLFLIKKFGCKILPNYYGFTCLHAAAESGNLQAIKFCIYHGADVNAKTIVGNEELPLHFLATTPNHFREMVGILMKNGADINGQNNQGNTILHFIVAFGEEIRTEGDLKFLVETCNASWDIENAEGYTAEQLAANGGNLVAKNYFASLHMNDEDEGEIRPVAHDAIDEENVKVLGYLTELFGMGYEVEDAQANNCAIL